MPITLDDILRAQRTQGASGWDYLLGAAGAVDQALSAPGDYARGAMTGQAGRVSASELLNQAKDALNRRQGYVEPQQDPGFAATMAADFATDPMNLIGTGLVAKAAAKAKRIKSLNAMSQKMRKTGAFTAEEAARVHHSLLGSGGVPKPLFHGTNSVFDEFDFNRADAQALHGPGAYLTDAADVAGGYPMTKRKAPELMSREETLKHYAPGNVVASQFDSSRDKVLRLDVNDDGSFKQVLVQAINDGGKPVGRPRTHATIPSVDKNAPNVRKHYLDAKRVLSLDNPIGGEASAFSGELPFAVAADSTGESVRAALVDKFFGETGSHKTAERLANRRLYELGFDAMSHTGGKIVGDGSRQHNVFIALDPSVVRQGYIAPELKPVPSNRKKIEALMLYNAMHGGGE